MSNVLFILTGSIACYKACDAISQLVQRGHSVRTIATKAALEFVGVATLEALTREKVGTELFAAGEALDHITLARWADVTIVCPATANTLNRMAAGLADDLAGSLLLAHDWQRPLLIAPAMNPAMWNHPATREAVQRLTGWGVRFVAPGSGRTACGEVGEGRLAEPSEIVEHVEAALVKPARRLRVLVTSGGTSEPVDGVRVLTNTSTGATGAQIAEQFHRAGHEVVLVRAAQAVPAAGVPNDTFVTFEELDQALARRLSGQDFDVVVHAAAVSDFAIDRVEVNGVEWASGRGKLPSGADPVIRLRRNPKLIESLRTRSRNGKIVVVGFKLTRDADEPSVRAAVQALLAGGGVDVVVHNDLARRGNAFPADIWLPGRIAVHCDDRAAIGAALERVLLTYAPAAGS